MPELNINSNRFNNLRLFIISLITSTILLFFCSKNSIIYPMNDWTDVNIFFAVEDSMFHGNVLYRDVFEHKGPFLYLIIFGLVHYLGNNYFAIYLLKCITNALFIYYSTKIILLYDDNAPQVRVFLYAVALEICLCTAFSFIFGGTVEELFLWTSSFGLYTTLRCLKCNQYFSSLELILFGVICGAIFWTKFSVLGFYAGLALYTIVWNVLDKTSKRLGKSILLFLVGFATTCIPEVIYCTVTNSFIDMVDVYFIGNIFGTHQYAGEPILRYELFNTLYNDFGIYILLSFSLIFIFFERSVQVRVLILTTLITAILASCCLVFFHRNYILPLYAFIPLGIIYFKSLILKPKLLLIILIVSLIIHYLASLDFSLYTAFCNNRPNPLFWESYLRLIAKAAFPLIVLLCAFRDNREINNNNYVILFIVYIAIMSVSSLFCYFVRDPVYFTKQSLPQTRFAKVISRTDNASVLLYKLYAHGFIKSSHTWPQVKYFCALNLIPEDMNREQLNYIKTEMVDFIITAKELEDEITNTSYTLVDTSDLYYYYGVNYRFYLYKKIPQVVSKELSISDSPNTQKEDK